MPGESGWRLERGFPCVQHAEAVPACQLLFGTLMLHQPAMNTSKEPTLRVTQWQLHTEVKPSGRLRSWCSHKPWAGLSGKGDGYRDGRLDSENHIRTTEKKISLQNLIVTVQHKRKKFSEKGWKETEFRAYVGWVRDPCMDSLLYFQQLKKKTSHFRTPQFATTVWGTEGHK